MSEPLTVILLTYERTEYALRTVAAAKQYLRYSNLHWYIADDGSSIEHVEAVRNALEGESVIGMHNHRSSYGASANRGIQTSVEHGHDLMLFLEDDWELTRPFDIWGYAALLVEDPTVGMVRTGYLNNGVKGEVFSHGGGLYWRLNDSDGRHHSHFAFTGHPALRHTRFHDTHGRYPERLQPGETELAMAWQVKCDRHVDVVWPAELGTTGPWAHIGTVQSYVWLGNGVLLPEQEVQ